MTCTGLKQWRKTKQNQQNNKFKGKNSTYHRIIGQSYGNLYSECYCFRHDTVGTCVSEPPIVWGGF